MIVAVHGAYFGYNFGDTLLCQLFTAWVHAAGEYQVTLPLANERNRRAIGADTRGLATTLRARCAIFGGGGHFSEPAHPRWNWNAQVVTRHLFLSSLLNAKRVPIALLGLGVGPVSSPKLRKAIVRLWETAELAVVRDEESATFLREWGLRRDLVVARDAVLSATFDVHKTAGDGRLRLVVHSSGHPDEGELATIRAVCQWASHKADVAIVLATDGIARRRPIKWPKSVAEEFSMLGPEIYLYDGYPDRMINFLAAADGVVTTKLHVGIVSTVLDVPVIASPRHSKTKRFYGQIGRSEQVASDGEQLLALLDDWHASNGVPAAPPRLETPFDYARLVAEFVSRHS